MKIRDVMNKGVQTVPPETLLFDVAKKMKMHDVGAVLVSKEGRLVGMITDRDIALRCVAEQHHPAETTAEQVMSPEFLYCGQMDEAEDVASIMGQSGVRRLVVLDADKKMVGIVSLGDLAISHPLTTRQ